MPHSAWNAGCGVNYHHVGASMGRRFVPEKKVRFAEFELDFGSFQLFRAGKPVHLESLPLQLLMFLVENQRQLVSR